MSIEKLISDYKKALEETERMKQCVITALNEEITDTPIPGVEKISGSPNAVSVKFSALSRGILAPEYYIPESQAKLVTERISGIVAPDVLVAALEEMIEKKRVVLQYTTHFLNETTISILNKVLAEIKTNKGE